MIGTYRFFQDGTLIGESKNLITDAGRRHVFRYLAGEESALAGSIAVGVGQVEPLGTDTRLTYEFDRATIYLVSPSYIDKKIIFKSTLSREVVGTIYEVGLYSTAFGSFSTGNPSRSLASFEETAESWSTGTFEVGNQRLGTESLRLTAAASDNTSSVLPSVGLDLSGYTNNDRVSVAFFCSDSHTSSVRFRFHSSDLASYYEFSILSPAQGYNIRSIPKASLARYGAADFSSIDSLSVYVSAKATGSTTVDFDGIRAEAFSPDIQNVLISRAVLPEPTFKTDMGDMDIEYALEVLI